MKTLDSYDLKVKSIDIANYQRDAIINTLNNDITRIEKDINALHKCAEAYASTHPDNTKSFEDNEQQYLHFVAPLNLLWYRSKIDDLQELISIDVLNH